MSERVVLVDGSDRELGIVEVGQAHDGEGILHRAFTIYVFDDRGRVMLQKRSARKRLWPSTWETSCSGHPEPGEDVVEAAGKRLRQELGFDAVLTVAGRIVYQAKYGDVGSENELCYVLVGSFSGEPRPDPEEVEELHLVDPVVLLREISERSDGFAPWVPGSLKIALTPPTGED